MPRVLIAGADDATGVELARQYAADGWEVVATRRNAAGLESAAENLSILPFDALNDRSLATLIDRIGTTPLDVVILNAGAGGSREQLVSEITQEDWMETVGTNTYAPAKLAIALRENLERGAMKKLVGISSLAASIGSGSSSGHYAFRASKAALNSIWRSFSVEWRQQGIICLLLAPVVTGAQSANAESVAGMRRRIAESTLADTGRFFSFDGSEVPW